MEKVSSEKYEIDMCNGPLLGKIMAFYMPLMLSGILQLLFNAADIVVVGQFAGNEALAAIGSTSSLAGLLVSFFIEFSVGVNILVARFYGAKRENDLSEIVQTAIAAAAIGGVLLVFLGFFLSRPALGWMGTPDNVISHSVLYMRIYFAGMPFLMVYDFGSAVLRAVGDTRRPFYYLLTASVINVALNLIFVIVFSMGVAGVALATVISQAISAALVVKCLIRTDSAYRLELQGIKIVPGKLLEMIRIGVPIGMQSALFSISSVLIQSSINSFGSTAIAGNTAAGNIEGFAHTAMTAFYQVAISFSGQNLGARKYRRIGKVLLICELLVVAVGVIMGNLSYLFGGTLLGLYTADPEVIAYGILRLKIICIPYFLCGMQEVAMGTLRGMGYTIMPMLVTLAGACFLRVAWIYTLFRSYPTLECLLCSFPVSYGVTFMVHMVCFALVFRKMLQRDPGIE